MAIRLRREALEAANRVKKFFLATFLLVGEIVLNSSGVADHDSAMVPE